MNLQGLNGFSICSKMAAVLKCKKNKMKWCSATTRMQTITHPKIQQVPRITGICFMRSRQQAAVYAAFFWLCVKHYEVDCHVFVNEVVVCKSCSYWAG